jgi:L-glyceraldehyde 3-phosphate reductase
MGALASAVKQGKALYVGISSYSAKKTAEAAEILRGMGIEPLIHQPSYSMLNRWIEEKLLDELERQGMGCIAFSPLAQGLLTGKYLDRVPEDSRAVKADHFFQKDSVLTKENLERVQALNEIAKRRGQSLAQLALSWCLRDSRVTTVLIGASRPEQIKENVAALDKLEFSKDELDEIDQYAKEGGVNMWAESSNAG